MTEFIRRFTTDRKIRAENDDWLLVDGTRERCLTYYSIFAQVTVIDSDIVDRPARSHDFECQFGFGTFSSLGIIR
jgi:hypothetical protein